MDDLLATIDCNHKIDTYTFTQNQCPRCNGTGRYHDLSIGNHGDLELVFGGKKLSQEVEKSLLNQVGTLIDDPYWGSELYRTSQTDDPSLIRAHIISSVINALKELKRQLDIEDNDFTLPSNEKIANKGIGDLQVLVDETEPRRLILRIVIVSEDRTDITLTTPLDI